MRTRLGKASLGMLALVAAALVVSGCCGRRGSCSPCGSKGCGSCAKTESACAKCDGPCAKACGVERKHAGVAEIGTASLQRLLSSGSAVTVLDARTGKWDDGRRLPGAKALSPSATSEEAAAAIKSKDSLVVTYCSSTTCKASSKLAKRLHELGYNNVVEYPVGIAGWVEAGNTVDTVN